MNKEPKRRSQFPDGESQELPLPSSSPPFPALFFILYIFLSNEDSLLGWKDRNIAKNKNKNKIKDEQGGRGRGREEDFELTSSQPSPFVVFILFYLQKKKMATNNVEKRQREAAGRGEEEEPPAKRARTELVSPFPAPDFVSSWLKRIVVLVGRQGQSDGEDVHIKYWDPKRCASVTVRRLLAEELKNPSRELVAFLLTGSEVTEEDLNEAVDPIILEEPYEELGVCEFKHVQQCDLDF